MLLQTAVCDLVQVSHAHKVEHIGAPCHSESSSYCVPKFCVP